MSQFSIALLVSTLLAFLGADQENMRMARRAAPRNLVGDSVVYALPIDPPPGDTGKVADNPNDRIGDPTRQKHVSPLYLANPKNIVTTFELAEDGSGYIIHEKIGEIDVRPPSFISFENYLDYRKRSGIRDYYRQMAMSRNEEENRGLGLDIDAEGLSDIFGGGSISIRPTGYASLNFSVDNNRTENPSLPLRQQRNTFFNFDQQIQLGVIGQIGEKLRLTANFDTQATFDFENQLKLEYTGYEDEIIQKIEAGNVSMRLGNSLIQGRQNLFGLKTELRFGPLTITAVGSNERGQSESITVGGGGAIETPFRVSASEYDENRHFFLSHFFRSKYEDALERVPIINSPLRIQRVEIWVEQQGATRNTRNALGLVDLGENSRGVAGGRGVLYNQGLIEADTVRFPDNNANNLYSILRSSPDFREFRTSRAAMENPGLTGGVMFDDTEDFQVVGNMRRLDPNEYNVNSQLGYVSLNSPIAYDQVLFVAYTYTYNGNTYQVGEFSDDIPANGLNSNVLFLKKLKSSVRRVSPYPAWDLMMKNIYSIGYGIQADGFFLDVLYESPTSAGKINYLPEGVVKNVPLIQVLNIDRLTNHTAPEPDNYFDYIEGITIIAEKGLVVFPVLEPFGSHLADQLNNDPNDSANYVFTQLYTETQQGAMQEYPQLDRYSIEGYYRSSSSAEIPLNAFNLSEGSVVVTANGRQLVEGQDFQVDYFGGKVTIINQAILESGQEINVSFESSSLYNVQNKTLLGARAEYQIDPDTRIGATIMNMRERPFNLKTTFGDEPINNTLWGLDGQIRKESNFITRIIDKIPGVSTTETSSVDAMAEFAQFIPGQPGFISTDGDEGVVFIDDFEAASSPFSLQSVQRWKLASFPEGSQNARLYDPRPDYPGNDLASNFTRAQLAWYQIDQTFYQGFGANIPETDLSSNYTRRVTPFELFPTASRAFGNNIQNTFDLRYRPQLRGPHNYQTDPAEIDPNTGEFVNPEKNWGGIMRKVDINNDFEATNVQVLEFWMMDPFLDNPNGTGGEFYIDMGLVNEDILTDQVLSRENGLPGAGLAGNLDSTAWGQVPIGNPVTPNFSTDPADREAQDIGLDGLDDEGERSFFETNYLGVLRNYLSPQAFAEVEADPTTDNFKHFRDPEFDTRQASILERYADFNDMQGNSPVGSTNNNFTTQATQLPDNEDLNGNGSLNYAEQYWQYRIRIHPDSLQRGRNYVIDEVVDTVRTDNNDLQEVRWYQFRIPLNSGRPVNGITDFRTISYLRMYLTGFSEEVIMRLTEFQFVATQWREYLDDLRDEGISTNPPQPPFARFDIGSVGLEENSQKLPFNYVLAPGVIRQGVNGNTNISFLQNERSLQLKVCDLEDGDARAVFKQGTYDMRLYENLRLWIHAEATEDGVTPSNFYNRGDATVFVRLGTDNDFNYYEYEIPLTPSDPALPGNVDNIWRPENEFNFELALLAVAKQARNQAGAGPVYRFAYQNDELAALGHTIYVKGTPKLSEVRNIMIGVRNPKDPQGRRICMELWANEMRLTNYDPTTGWAANANLALKLADLATINGSIFNRTAGFGPLEQKPTQRSTDNVFRFDVSMNLNLHKFLPEKWGLQLPIYATYGQNIVNPEFNPQEADVPLDRLIEGLPPEEASETIKEVQNFRRTRSIALTNWRKTRSRRGGGGDDGGGNKFYNISNFDFTYAFNDQFQRTSIVQRHLTTQHRFAVNYRYNFPQVIWEPFKNVKFKPISWINLSPLPTSISYSINGNRQFEERIMRPTNQFGGNTDPFYTKNFLINTNWNLTWNLTRNLQLSWNASNISRVDEVKGYWDEATQRERDSVGNVWDNIISFGQDPSRNRFRLINIGRLTSYNHTFNATWLVPFNQFRPLDWINVTLNYSGGYQWNQAPEIDPILGGTIANNQNIQLNSRIDLNSFYRKFKGLAKALDPKPKSLGNSPRPGRPGAPAQPAEPAAEDSTRKSPALVFFQGVGREILRIMMSVRSLDFNYTLNSGTTLPGYLPYANQFGLHFNYLDTLTGQRSPVVAPTPGFIFGGQADIRPVAVENGWLSRDTSISTVYNVTRNEQFTGRGSIELFAGLRVDLSVNRNYMEGESEFFRFDPSLGTFRSFDPQRQGSFSMSYILIGTAFDGTGPESEVFEQFSEYRKIISQRLAAENPNTGNLSYQGLLEGGFTNGYPGSNQEVLIPAFLAAYGVYDPNKVTLSPFPDIPLPNWNINYNGLSSIPGLKKIFTSITLKHGYRATYSVATFINNLKAVEGGNGLGGNFDQVGTDANGNPIESFYAVNTVQVAQMTEQFSPLFGVTLNFKNGLTSSIEYKTGRQLNFSVGNLQLSETKNQDFSLLIGYRKDKLNLFLNLGKKELRLNNTLNIQLRATIRNTIERLRYLSANGIDATLAPDPTRGSLNLIISPSIDYVVNQRLRIKLFFEHNSNTPYVANSFRTSFTSAGVQIRFTLNN